MLVHRHVWADGTFSNWHDAARKHTNEAYAADKVFETREAKTKKEKLPEYSYDEAEALVKPAKKVA